MNDITKTVLVIDDAVETHELIQRTLRGTEFEAYKADDGREGVKLAKTLVPDLIILDIMMPQFDGFMTSSILQRNETTKNIPIIFLSGRKSKEDIHAAIKSGGVDYVVKPFSPSDLLTRIRKVMETQSAIKKKKDGLKNMEKPSEDAQTLDAPDQAPVKFVKYDDIIVVTPRLASIVIANSQVYRGVFQTIINDGIFIIIFDMEYIRKIDSAGLAMLLSVNESVKKYGGILCITMPSNEINKRFSFAQLNALFRAYPSVDEALAHVREDAKSDNSREPVKEANICMACTYVNRPESRFCSFCGTNLVIGKGEMILEILKKTILHRVLEETDTLDSEEGNKPKIPDIVQQKVPLEFDLECIAEHVSIFCRGKFFENVGGSTEDRISIRLPRIKKAPLPVVAGMQIIIRNAVPGIDEAYQTCIESTDLAQSFITVPYPEEARILHSIKNFSIAPKMPIPIVLTIPNLQFSGGLFRGKVLELSRVRLTIFSDSLLPENQCLAASFELTDGNEISSPLIMVQKGQGKFMYTLEFILIDERERTKIIQYMYKRQIELSKTGAE